MATFGKALDAKMHELGITAKELSDMSGVYPSYISRILSGKLGDPKWGKARALVHALGMTTDEFAEYQDSFGPEEEDD